MLASTLALLLVSATATAFVTTKDVQAEDPKPINELKILKKLKIAKGVKTPTKDFNFTFTKHSFNTKTEDNEKNQLPDITGVKVSYGESDTLQGTDTTINKDATVTLTDKNWPKAGQYTYEVQEADITNDTSTTDAYEGIYTKSTAKYLVSFLVTDNGTSKQVSSIWIKRETADSNDTGATQDTNKVEYKPTPGPNEENGLKFTNIYNKKVKGLDDNNKTDETKQKLGLLIKKVVNDGASAAFKGQDFRFKVTVTAPNTVTNPTSDIQFNATGDAKTTNNAYGATGFEFNLKGDQWAALSNVYLGSTVVVEEIDPKGAASAIISGTAGSSAITAENNAQFKTVSFVLTEDGNNVEFKNQEQTPTGVLMDMLPFIILAIVAIGGIYYFKHSRSHQA